MKQLLTTIAFSTLSLIGFSQVKEGRIIYERHSKPRVQFANPAMENSEIAKRMSQVQISSFELLFGNNQSVWQALPDINQEANQMTTSDAGGGRTSFMVTRMGGDDVVYYNFTDGKRVSSRELSAKKYVIDDTIAKYNWKMTDETKTILTYKAMKAIAEIYTKRMMMSMENGEMKRKEVPDTLRVTAWFTPQIAVPVGPVYQGQLPGAILELDINNGQTVYKAVGFSPKVSLASIKEPKGGKRITQSEYDQEMQKAAEETRRRLAENGGHIRIQQ